MPIYPAKVRSGRQPPSRQHERIYCHAAAFHQFATVATSMIVWARETGPGLRGCRRRLSIPQADQRKVRTVW